MKLNDTFRYLSYEDTIFLFRWFLNVVKKKERLSNDKEIKEAETFAKEYLYMKDKNNNALNNAPANKFYKKLNASYS